MRAVTGANEVFEEGECRDRRAEDVQCEERQYDPGRNVLRGLREDAVDGRGEGDQGEEASEPGDRLAGPVEHKCAQGATNAQSATAPDSTNPPRLHWRRKGSRRNIATWLAR